MYGGLRVLGAPLGHPDWCKQWLADFVTDLQPLFDAVSELASHDTKGAAQAAFLILRYSAGTKFSYLLRMTPPDIIEAATVAHDEADAPGPRRDFILSLGFALQRANSRMLRDADRRRRKARSCGIYSSGTRPSSLSSDDDY